MDDKDLIKNLEELKKDDQKAVEKASEYIVKSLVAAEHTHSTKKTLALPGQSKTFGDNTSEDLDYILKRIITGCTDSSPTTQLNFTIPLIKILNKFQNAISLRLYLKYVNEVTNRKNAVSQTQTNHFAIGKIYCLLAVAQAGMIRENNKEETETILLLLFTELSRTPWLEDAVIEVLRHLFAGISAPGLLKTVLKQMNSRLKDTLKDNTLGAIRTLFVLREGYKKAGLNDFPYEKNLQEKVFNHKNLKLALGNAIEKFPRLSPGIKDVIQYISDVSRTADRRFEIWEEFWTFIVKEFTFAHGANQKHIFITLSMLKKLLKSEQFRFEDLRYVFNDELVQLWLKNLSVMNQDTKKVALKIEKLIVDLVQNQFQSDSDSDRKTLFDFIQITKLKPNYRFSAQNHLATTLYSALNKQQLQELFKHLKKRLLASHNEQERYFLLNEIYVLAEIQFQQMEESEFLDTVFLLFEEMNESKLEVLYTQLEEETKEEQTLDVFIAQNQEIIISFLQSLLALCVQSSNEAFKDKQSNVWKGRTGNYDSWLFRIMMEIKKKSDYFKENKSLSETLKIISAQLEFTENLEKEIKKNLKQLLNKTDKDQKFNKKLKRDMAISNLYLSLCLSSLFSPEEYLDNLEEIKMIYLQIQNEETRKGIKEQTTQKRKLNDQKSKTIEKSSDKDGGISPEQYIHALTDLLIALLSKSTGFLREMVNTTFQAFVQEVDSFSLSILTSVLTRNNQEFLDQEGDGDAFDEQDDQSEEERLLQQEEDGNF